ncbi:MAG TPA: hypothetical protein VEK55_15475 [Xanthobacteraceae bacterium]|nr:hypothetical protein [Xanthobacteraceae bacterium]
MAEPFGLFVAFFADTRSSSAFLVAFFLIALVFPIVFPRLRASLAGVFLGFGFDLDLGLAFLRATMAVSQSSSGP